MKSSASELALDLWEKLPQKERKQIMRAAVRAAIKAQVQKALDRKVVEEMLKEQVQRVFDTARFSCGWGSSMTFASHARDVLKRKIMTWAEQELEVLLARGMKVVYDPPE